MIHLQIFLFVVRIVDAGKMRHTAIVFAHHVDVSMTGMKIRRRENILLDGNKRKTRRKQE